MDHELSKNCWCEPRVEAIPPAEPTVEVTAAAFLWGIYREINWTVGTDDPRDVELYEQGITEARRRWPWLDEAADTLVGEN